MNFRSSEISTLSLLLNCEQPVIVPFYKTSLLSLSCHNDNDYVIYTCKTLLLQFNSLFLLYCIIVKRYRCELTIHIWVGTRYTQVVNSI